MSNNLGKSRNFFSCKRPTCRITKEYWKNSKYIPIKSLFYYKQLYRIDVNNTEIMIIIFHDMIFLLHAMMHFFMILSFYLFSF